VTPSTLHYELAGPADGPPLLLGNSLGTTLQMWDPQLAGLTERGRVIRYDHRGHGASPVPRGPYDIAQLGSDVLALLDRLEVQHTSYCGLSLGGMVGMWLAANAPERIDKLILISTSAHLPPASAWTERAAAVRDAGTTDVIADSVLARWLTPPFAREHEALVSRLRAMLVSTPASGYASCCEVIGQLDLTHSLPSIGSPTLVIAGEQDPTTPPEHARVIADAVPGARLEIVTPAAHLANMEQSAAVTRLIVEHLDRQEAR
jgi:3-oxoadipate enol-lactonase